jgi:hypothetical protein
MTDVGSRNEYSFHHSGYFLGIDRNKSYVNGSAVWLIIVVEGAPRQCPPFVA